MILRRATPGTLAPGAADRREKPAAPELELPDFLLRPATPEMSPAPPLKPATALAAANMIRQEGTAVVERAALERGRLMHVLLQYLPQVSPASRRAAAQAFLSARAGHLSSDHAHLIEEALGVLETEGLAELSARAREPRSPPSGGS